MNETYRYYVVTYSEKDTRNYRRTGCLGVVAKDILQAVDVAQQLKPEMVIWNVSHHGEVNGIATNAQFLVLVP